MGGKVVRFRTRPEVPASIRYTPDELAVLCAQQKKRSRRRTTRGAPGPTDAGPGQPLGGYLGRGTDGPPGIETLSAGLRHSWP